MASAVGSIQAWVFTHEGYPDALHRATLAPLPKPASKELHVRVKAAALNPVDVQLMNLPAWRYLPRSWISPDKGIGEDFSGVVEAAGKHSGFDIGDEVYGITFTLTSGTIQDVIAVDTRSSIVVKKPKDMSWEQAAALPLVWLTARTTIAKIESSIEHSGCLAVLGGSSAVGMHVLQIANQRRWKVLTTCSSRNTELVKSMGARFVVDHNTNDVTQAVRDFGPAAIIDCVGGTSCIGLAERYVTIVGDKTSRDTMGGAAIYLWHPKMVIRTLLGKIGLGKSYDCVNLELRKEWLEETLNLDRSKIVIDSTWGFHQVKEAFAKLNTGRARGKVVVRVCLEESCVS